MTPGWLHEGEGDALAAHAAKCPGPWVELGSYCGLSTTFLGRAALHLGVTVFAVDPHQGNPEMAEGRECYHPEVWEHENGSLSVLLQTLHAEGLEDVVVPVVGTGEQFAATGVRPGFVFIDASHEYADARADFDTWGALLADGGMVALHDSEVEHWGPGKVLVEAMVEGWTLVDRVRSLAVLSR